MDNQGDTDGEIAVSMENEKPASASGSADTTTKGEHRSSLSLSARLRLLRQLVVVVTFFNHNFVNCKATLILEIKKIYEIKYHVSLSDVHTWQ